MKSEADVGDVENDEAAKQVDAAQRRRRVLQARDEAAKARLDLLTKEAEIRKKMAEVNPPPPPPQPMRTSPSQIMAPAPVIPPSAKEKIAEEGTDVVSRFATLAISGREGHLTAIMRIKGFGEVKVKKGDALPNKFKVAGIEYRGVSVKKDTGPAILVPFAQ